MSFCSYIVQRPTKCVSTPHVLALPRLNYSF
uniref:Uncharacterized protein n=1 Tax=Arundo donax TaxID=35708 RepID=A0A0A9BN66_ARUDO